MTSDSSLITRYKALCAKSAELKSQLTVTEAERDILSVKLIDQTMAEAGWPEQVQFPIEVFDTRVGRWDERPQRAHAVIFISDTFSFPYSRRERKDMLHLGRGLTVAWSDGSMLPVHDSMMDFLPEHCRFRFIRQIPPAEFVGNPWKNARQPAQA